MSNLILSPKFRDFLTTYCKREYLEGTTAAGKTTVGIPKFLLRVGMSDKKDHVLAGTDLGTVEKNIINSELGILAQFEEVCEYHSGGKGKIRLPHIEYHSPKGIKIIYVCGYDNKTRWKKVLGSQMGCVFIDEVNIADMEFLREITHRCEYMMTTSNPDDPNLPVYKEFINHSRPLKRYIDDYPRELLDELNESYTKGWVHWYFTFYDNASMSDEDIEEKKTSVPEGTKMYKNKIQGLRGRATGLVFNLENKHIITPEQAMEYEFVQFSCGVDTSYSRDSDDTIAFVFEGITKCRKLIILAEETYNNKDLARKGIQALAPSDIPPLLVSFLERNRKRWIPGKDAYARDIYIDSADQATMTELLKYNNEVGSIYDFYNAWKKLTIIDRIQFQLGWMKDMDYLIVDECREVIHEQNTYSWKEDKHEPEDANDHTINASQYGWIPYKEMIGGLK